jgi:hypothetical protein
LRTGIPGFVRMVNGVLSLRKPIFEKCVLISRCRDGLSARKCVGWRGHGGRSVL